LRAYIVRFVYSEAGFSEEDTFRVEKKGYCRAVVQLPAGLQYGICFYDLVTLPNPHTTHAKMRNDGVGQFLSELDRSIDIRDAVRWL
jgi:hypothetical protein